MQISFYSLLMAVVWSSLFILVLCLLRNTKSQKGFLYYNIAPLSVLFLGCILRCVLPLDLLNFTESIPSSRVLAKVNTALRAPLPFFSRFGKSISPLMIFFAIWATVTLVLLVRFLWRLYKDMSFMGFRLEGIYTEICSGPIYNEAISLAGMQSVKKVRVFQDTSIVVPMVCGILYPRILLPETDYAEAELRYILSHELAHWKNGDMWVRFFTLLICCLFWWNPFVYLLLYRMEETLEFQCDATVVSMKCISDDERLLYLDTILHAIENKKQFNKENQIFLVRSELTRHRMSKEDFQRRVDIIGNYTPNPAKQARIIIVAAIIMTLLMLFSYRYIVQPYYNPPEEDFTSEGGCEFSSKDSYLVLEPDGTYSLYIKEKDTGQVTPEFADMLIKESGFTVKTRKD